MFKSKRRRIIFLTALSFVGLVSCFSLVFTLTGRKQESPSQKQEATAQGECPKLEGSFLGVDKANIQKGEAVRLSYKLPREYVAGLRIEGVNYPTPPEISSFKAEASSLPLTAPEPPPFYEGTNEVKPERTITYVLKAAGPKGCQPLELPARVEVK